jgi:hypothetical protein
MKIFSRPRIGINYRYRNESLHQLAEIDPRVPFCKRNCIGQRFLRSRS